GAGTTLITARDAASQSAAYPVLVVTAFAIDDSLVSLTGTASYTRAATGGVPPYTYTSSNSTIIRVPNSSEGVIQAVADGKATITARDSASGSGSYPVSVGPEPPKPIKPPIGLPTVDGMVNGTLHSSYGVMRVRAPNYPDITSGDKIDYVWERPNQAAFGESVWVDGTLVVPPGTFDMPFVLGKQTVWYWVIRGPYALKSGSVEFQVVYP
ncbi:MAG TPA: hypothetical protein VM621_02995, partial [Luteibacter sp.]|uniref:hypothetical protein n=1 Tax=Luteibacter sp. TaxID=1886636 RepID=UPI002B585E35